MSCESSAAGGNTTRAVSISTLSSPSSVVPNSVSASALLLTIWNWGYSLLRQSLPNILPLTSTAYVPRLIWSPSTLARMTLSSAVSMEKSRLTLLYWLAILTATSVQAGRGKATFSPSTTFATGMRNVKSLPLTILFIILLFMVC